MHGSSRWKEYWTKLSPHLFSYDASIRGDKPPEETISLVVGHCGIWQALILTPLCLTMFIFGSDSAMFEMVSPSRALYKCEGTEKWTYSCCYPNGTSCPHVCHPKYKDTINCRFEFVCTEQEVGFLSNNLWKLGIIIGSITFGVYADTQGRRIMLLVSHGLKLIVGCLYFTLGTWYVSFIMLTLLFGIGTGGAVLAVLIMITEISSNRLRTLTLGVACLFYGLGVLLLHFMDQFRYKSVIVPIPIRALEAVVFVVSFGLPQSPNWLLINSKGTEAQKIMFKAARMNRVILTPSVELLPTYIAQQIARNADFRLHFRYKRTTYIVLVLFSLWSLSNVCWFLLCHDFLYEKRDSTSLGVAIVLGALMSTLFCHLLHHKLVILSSLIITEIIVICYWRNVMTSWTAEMYGVTIISVAYFSLINLTPRVFCTTMRSKGLGLCMCCGYASQIIPPYFLTYIYHLYVEMVFFACSLLMIILCLFLWKVHFRELPDAFTDSLNFKRDLKPSRYKCVHVGQPSILEEEMATTSFSAIRRPQDAPDPPREKSVRLLSDVTIHTPSENSRLWEDAPNPRSNSSSDSSDKALRNR